MCVHQGQRQQGHYTKDSGKGVTLPAEYSLNWLPLGLIFSLEYLPFFKIFSFPFNPLPITLPLPLHSQVAAESPVWEAPSETGRC